MNHVFNQTKSLVDLTVVFLPKDKMNGENKSRTLFIYMEFYEQGKRWYGVKDIHTRQTFAACADTYDAFFFENRHLVIQKNKQLDY